MDPGHSAASEGQAIDKPAQRHTLAGFRPRKIGSAGLKNWLPLVELGRSRRRQRLNLGHCQGLVFHVHLPAPVVMAWFRTGRTPIGEAERTISTLSQPGYRRISGIG
jgi:hypothetical protein